MELPVHMPHPVVEMQATDTTAQEVAEAQLGHRQQASTGVMAPEETATSRIQVSKGVTPALTTRILMATQGVVVTSRP